MDLAPDFDEFCASLNARDVEYVIVGAHALAFHGAPRFTGDPDIFVRPTEENGRRLLGAIADFGCPTAPVMPADVVVGRNARKPDRNSVAHCVRTAPRRSLQGWLRGASCTTDTFVWR